MITIEPQRRALLLMFATGAAAVAPLAAELPWWALVIAALGAAWRYLCDSRSRRHPGRLLRWTLTLAAAAGVYGHYGTLFGRDPGLSLLVVLLGLKFLELRTRRDSMLSVFLFFVLLAGAYLYTQALWLGLYTVLVVLLAALTMLELTQGTGMTRAVRLRFASVLLLQALPLALVAFVLFPRLQGSLWGLPRDAHAGLTGLSEDMQPGSLGALSESEEIAFRAALPRDAIQPAGLYWRALVLWDTDGKRWTRGEPIAGRDALRPLSAPLAYTVMLEPSNKPWLPVLDLPSTVPAGARLDFGFALARNLPVRERLSYRAHSVLRYATGELDASVRARALALPQRMAPRARELARAWQAQQPDDAAIAAAALRHFRAESFSYTLQPPLLGADPVDEFLFSTRRGYCEHYAAAFVTLMRAAGVPARVVLGYQGGEHSAAGDYYIVQQADAHAWAEIWIAGNGWLRIDPTAAVAPERIELGANAVRRLAERGIVPGALGSEALARALALTSAQQILRQARLYWDWADVAWYRWVAGYDHDIQTSLLRVLGFIDMSAQVLVLLLASVAAILLAAYAWWLLKTGGSRDPIQALYARYCHKLARIGLVRAPQEGPLAYAARCRTRRPALAPAIDQITDLYVSLRYGCDTSDGAGQALRAAVKALRVS
ncbi:MAG: DUF3488 domain-containing transglutaminase family protein [Pseudomonadota bacterium]|nr:MAG: DUF3488 domain-containing transglutaminase family protein [Pseudomonadota bacterium]